MKHPSKIHWKAVKWILRFLTEIANVGLVYRREKISNKTTRYVDSNHINNLDERRYLAGYVFTLTGDAVNWKESLQDHIALSSTETEYVALTFITNEAIWLGDLLLDYGLDQINVNIYYDNQCVIFFTCNPVYH